MAAGTSQPTGSGNYVTQISGELILIREELQKLANQMPQLNGVSLADPTEIRKLKDRLLLDSGKGMEITVKREDSHKFVIVLKKEATVKELKIKLEKAAGELLRKQNLKSRINWKHIWKRYWLTHGPLKLADDCKRLSQFGVFHGSELHFVKRLRSK